MFFPLFRDNMPEGFADKLRQLMVPELVLKKIVFPYPGKFLKFLKSTFKAAFTVLYAFEK